MIDVATSVKQLGKSLDIMEKELPFMASLAARHAVTEGRKEALKQAHKGLHEPIPALFNEKRGWIFVQWDNKAEVKAKGFVEAHVQIRGKGSNKKELEAQQEIAHRNIYGTRVKNTPISIPYIIKPSKYLRPNTKIKGVPLVIDKHGNIKGRGNKSYADTVTDMVKNPKYKGQFFEVRIGEVVRRGKQLLPPGLYQRLLFKKRKSDYAKHPVTKNRRGPYKPSGPKYVAKFLLTILQYFPLREYKGNWNFKQPTKDVMRKEFNSSMIHQIVGLKLAQGRITRRASKAI